MPDKKTHQHIGAGCGAAFAAFEAKDQPNVYFWIELIGGALGGYSGGTLPDWLEPALGSWHRGVCHSAAAGTAVFFVRSVLANWANICRQNAHKCRIVPQVENVHTGERLPIQRTPMQQGVGGDLRFRLAIAGRVSQWPRGGICLASHLGRRNSSGDSIVDRKSRFKDLESLRS